MTKNKVSYEQAVALCDIIVKSGSELLEKREDQMDKVKMNFDKTDTLYYPVKIKTVFEYKSPKGKVYRYPETPQEDNMTIVLCGNLFWAKPCVDLLNVKNSIRKIDDKVCSLEKALSAKSILSSILSRREFRNDDTIDIGDFVNCVQEYQNKIGVAFKEMYKTIDNLKLVYKRLHPDEKQKTIIQNRKDNSWTETILKKSDYER